MFYRQLVIFKKIYQQILDVDLTS